MKIFQARKDFGSVICSTCETGDCDFEMYRNNLIKAVSFFILGVRERNGAYLEAIENPSPSVFDVSLNITAMYKLNGYDVTKTGPFCQLNKKKNYNTLRNLFKKF